MPKQTYAAFPSPVAPRDAMRLVWNECLDALSIDPSPSFGRDPLSPERLFDALDGRTIMARGAEYLVEIYSVTPETDATWLQLSLHGETSFSLLLRLAPDEGTKHAVHILSSWLTNRVDRTHVFNVA